MSALVAGNDTVPSAETRSGVFAGNHHNVMRVPPLHFPIITTPRGGVPPGRGCTDGVLKAQCEVRSCPHNTIGSVYRTDRFSTEAQPHFCSQYRVEKCGLPAVTQRAGRPAALPIFARKDDVHLWEPALRWLHAGTTMLGQRWLHAAEKANDACSHNPDY